MVVEIPQSFDYVVVGGGTSGLVVAARLSEDPDTTVCILEAGENHLEDPQIAIPALWPNLFATDVDWQYLSVPQDGFGGRSAKLPAGKLLGGSSGLNGQILIAPSKAGIDAWAELGYRQWSWESLAPYYKRFHTLHLPDDITRQHLGIDWVDPKVVGTSGPIQASFAGVVEDPIGKAWVDTFRSLDFATNADPFSGKSIGGYANACVCDPETKTRSYSATAYFAPAASRPNLTLITGALARNVVLEGKPPSVKATGVAYLHDGADKVVRANKEVIMAAGAVQTPKILELSGIGDKQLLAKHGIDLIIDNSNVGENLQDHVMTGISMEAVDGVPTGDSLMRQEPAAVQEAMDLYAKHKAGPLAGGSVSSHAFMPTPDLDKESGASLQSALLVDALGEHSTANDRRFYQIVRNILDSPSESSAAVYIFPAQGDLHTVTSKFFDPDSLKPGSFLTFGSNLCHPFSRGNTHITSNDPTSKPRIDPKYFSHPADIEILARHFQFLEKLAKTKPLADYIKPAGMRNHPTAYVEDLDDAKRYLGGASLSNWHYCGSCAMMPQEKGGVVDGDLIVHGTQNLRVIDASIFPLIPRGNIMSTVYATAEKAADVIKGKA